MKNEGLCFGCLGRGHMSRYCKNRMTCQVCQQNHSSILHINLKEKVESQVTKRDFGESAKVTSSLVSLDAGSLIGAGNDACKLSIVPVQVKLCKGTKVVQTYAFLDPGSTATFCTEELMTALNYKIASYKIPGMEVAGLKGNTFSKLPDVFLQESIPVSKDNIPTEEDLKEWPYLKDVELEPIEASIGLLIGANAPKVLEPWRVINSKGNGPFAVKTLLGWVINGPLGHKDCMSDILIDISSLEDILTQQYNQDFAEQRYEQQEMSVEDKQFMNIVSDSAVLKDGHYYLKLPFREPDVIMPNNRHSALQRAQQLLKRLKRDQTFFEEYRAFMQDVLVKGHAEVVPQDQWKAKVAKCGTYHIMGSTTHAKRSYVWCLTVHLHFMEPL
ncbi:hypothetical protein N1851_024335 [Merluccius polli]|uniref:CCHC-type domain-containing protein n=1 Tax=Merluccius polli TaxID=89951 RepID=A0AA47MF17_MERPO|nr:hypothetical protein N1851_024335 [Merluccius polli]